MGSAVDIRKRMLCYYSLKYLANSNSMAICRALSKYGHSNFRLEILEYCAKSDVISREQYYLDLLKPDYNLLPTAGSRMGQNHTEETKIQMSESHRGKTISEETRIKMSKSAQGKIYTAETKMKISKANGKAIKVIDLETNLTFNYVSVRKAAEALGVANSTLFYHFKKSSCFCLKGRYQIEKIQEGS